jgi:hypothetical protein
MPLIIFLYLVPLTFSFNKPVALVPKLVTTFGSIKLPIPEGQV